MKKNIPEWNCKSYTTNSGLETHNDTASGNPYFELHTPFHVMAMYNICGIPGVTNHVLFASPLGADYITYNEKKQTFLHSITMIFLKCWSC